MIPWAKNNLIIEDPMMVAGFFREALFFNHSIYMELGQEAIELIPEELIENNPRAVNEKKCLLLKSAVEIETFTDIESSFQCFFPNLVGKWQSRITRISPQSIKMEIPLKVCVSNERQSIRVANLIAKTQKSRVIITTENIHCDGFLSVENYSVNGVGGLLSVPAEMPITTDSTLSSQIRLDGGVLSLTGRLVRVEILPGVVDHLREITYRIGVQSSNESPETVYETERRAGERIQALFPIRLKRPLAEDADFDINVVNASVSGFAASVRDPSICSLIPMGVTIDHINSSLRSKVVGFKDGLFRFQIVDGSPDDRLNWLKSLDHFRNSDTFSKTAVGFDLVSLFCQSGALASGYLLNQRRTLQSINDSFTSETGRETWLHRWIERDNKATLKGHICAAMIGDHAWHFGEIAGGQEARHKISRHFIPKFFSYFTEYALSCSPCPFFVIAWNEDHGYWRKFEQYLKEDGSNFVIASFHAHYTRLASLKLSISGNTNISITPIHAKDYDIIRTVCKNLQDQNIATLVEILGFSIGGFGSPTTKNSIQKCNQQFSREYAIVTVDKQEYLLILSAFPAGSSISQTLDVCWLVPLGKHFENKDPAIVSNLGDSIKRYGIERGFSVPGVFTPRTSIGGINSVTKTMLWSITHPLAFNFFKRKI